MFTIEEITAAHSKVKSGADFPAYIQEIKRMGVTSYEVFVSDGSNDYYGSDGFKASRGAKYEPLDIAENLNADLFKADLKAHQQGKTDYLTFIQMCAACGINKWVVDMDNMTCTYFDLAGNEVLEEIIPG